MVNFNIIEGDYSLEEKYEEFKNYYLKPEEISLAEIKKRLNLTHSQVRTLRQQVCKETGLKRSTSSRKLIPATKKRGISSKKYLEKYDDFEEIYLNRLDYSKNDIKEQLEINEHEYNVLRSKCNNKTGFKRRGDRKGNTLVKFNSKL